jgi:hypothetical protein
MSVGIDLPQRTQRYTEKKNLFPGFLASLEAPLGSLVAASGCAVAFGILWVGVLLPPLQAGDCDRSGVEDSAEIAAGIHADCNADGVPDACELVPVSFAYVGGTVTVGDAPVATLVADLDGDGRADVVTANEDPRGRVTTSTVSVVLASSNGLQEAVTYAAADSMTWVAAGDLDDDGDLDLASAHVNELQVFPNAGDGMFAEPVSLAVPEFTDFVLAVDVDGDGRTDLVTSNSTANEVGVLRRSGPVEFKAALLYPVGEEPTQVDAADLDGDGDVDLVSTNRGTKDLTILANAGDGTFAAADSFKGLMGFDASVEDTAPGDVDGDGNVDLAVVLGEGFAVLRNAGDGQFEEPVVFEVGVRSLEFGDFDGDGDLDLAFAGDRERRTLVYLNPGDGAFQFATTFALETARTSVADLDGDGDLDFVMTHDRPPRLEFLWNGESGAVPLAGERYSTLGLSHGHTIADLDGDGDLDVATADGPNRSVSILSNRGDGTFEDAFALERVDPGHLQFVCGADLDGDGDNDLATAGRASGLISILLGAGDGTFSEPVPYDMGGTPQVVVSRDLDQDGDLDLVTVNRDANQVGILLNRGDASFADPVRFSVGAEPLGVDAGDLDGDGDMDILSASFTSSSLSLLRGHGDGTFDPAVEIPALHRPGYVTLGDFDRDGDLDAATSNRGARFELRTDFPGDLSVFENRGDASFEPERVVPFGHGQWSVITTDVDGDGLLDLVAASPQASLVGVLPGRGDGSFAAAISFQTGTAPLFVFPGDLDGDGTTDLVSSDRQSRTITVFLNRSATFLFAGDFLTRVCTELDFHKVSRQAAASQEWDHEALYMVPASDDPDLLPAAFPNTVRFSDVGTFLGEVFPERFPVLTPDGLERLLGRRASREYFAGGIRRLPGNDGGVLYGVDIFTDPADAAELLEDAEVAAVLERVQASFELQSLAYAPATRAAQEQAAGWNDASFPLVIISETDEPSPEPAPEATPSFELEIPSETMLCGVFQERTVDRGVREELALKCQVRLASGIFPLPTVEETFESELIDEVLFGPERELAEPQGPGVFRVRRVAGSPDSAGALTTYRFTYAKPFLVPDGRALVLEIVAPLLYRARGDEPVERRRPLAPETFVALAGSEALQVTLDGAPLIHLGSCTYETLPRWNVRADLAGGGRIELEERYQEAQSELATAPASVTRATVVLAGEERTVTDYFDLVYSGSRHNTRVDYWVVLDPPIVLDAPFLDSPGSVEVLELQAPESHPELRRDASVAFLDADFQVLARPDVKSFTRTPGAETLFLRGDSGGDGVLDVTDAIGTLQFLFAGSDNVACLSAADTNDDGRINIVDPIAVIAVLFGRADALAAPFPECGDDPTADGLSCRSSAPCL